MQLLFSVTLFLSDSIARDPDSATPLLVAAPSACLCLWSGLVLLLLFQYAPGSVCILLFRTLCFLLVHLSSSVLSHFSKSKLFILIYFYGYPAFALFETKNIHCAIFQHLIS
jgi:hypothetical protein